MTMKLYSLGKTVSEKDKENWKLLGIFISVAVYIFGAGMLYQKSIHNAEQINLLISQNIRADSKEDRIATEIKRLSERLSSLEAKIQALDAWCRKNLKKK